MRHLIALAALLLICGGLAACSDDDRGFTYYEAGQYKGTTDPLLAKNLHEQLNNRFMAGQTDR